MGLFEEQFEGITDRYGNKIKMPEKKPTLKQSICAWGLVNELANIRIICSSKEQTSETLYIP